MTEINQKNTQISNFGKSIQTWRPGQSGNPKGRPKGKKDGLRAQVNRLLKKNSLPQVIKILEAKGINVNEETNADTIAAVMIMKALSGDLRAIKLIGNMA